MVALLMTTLGATLVVIHTAHILLMLHLLPDSDQNLHKDQHRQVGHRAEELLAEALEPVAFGQEQQLEDFLAICLEIESKYLLCQQNNVSWFIFNQCFYLTATATNRILFALVILVISTLTKIGAALLVEPVHRVVQAEAKALGRELPLGLEAQLDVKRCFNFESRSKLICKQLISIF